MHLLTELVDNALNYSSPETTVSLASTSSPGGVMIRSRTPASASRRQRWPASIETLRSGAEVTPDTARRMGLFVVSRLAQRHGITVVLGSNHHNGITATVLLPTAILDAPTSSVTATPGATVSEPAAAIAEPEPEAHVPAEPAPMSLEARIAAARGLPQRQSALAPAAGREPTPTQGPITTTEPVPTPEPVTTTEPVTAAPEPSAPRPVSPLPTRTPGTSPQPVALTGQPEVEAPAPTEPATSAVEPVAPAATTSFELSSTLSAPTLSALDMPSSEVARLHPPTETDDGPIFRSMRSAWLSANGGEEPWQSSEIEAGWDRADVVAESEPELPVTPSGLPKRAPGTRLVPGGVTKQATAAIRDPEAVRRRLSAHAAGVSRGRAAASADHHPTEGPA